MTANKIYSSVYQDVYRIHTGVIFLVNKFTQVYYSLKDVPNKRYYNSEYLRILTDNAINEATGEIYRIGTVIYEGFPIRLAEKNMWSYELKLCSGACVGGAKEFRQLTEIMNDIIEGKYDEITND